MHITLLEVAAPVLNAERADISIAVEPLGGPVSQKENPEKKKKKTRGCLSHVSPRVLNRTDRIILYQRDELRIRHHAIKRAVNLGRNRPFDFKVECLALESTWLHKSRELREIRKLLRVNRGLEMASHFEGFVMRIANKGVLREKMRRKCQRGYYGDEMIL